MGKFAAVLELEPAKWHRLKPAFWRGADTRFQRHSALCVQCLSWVNRVTLAVGRLLPVFPPEADIVRAGRHVSKVPGADVSALAKVR
jgi:hypothetical protein